MFLSYSCRKNYGLKEQRHFFKSLAGDCQIIYFFDCRDSSFVELNMGEKIISYAFRNIVLKIVFFFFNYSTSFQIEKINYILNIPFTF